MKFNLGATERVIRFIIGAILIAVGIMLNYALLLGMVSIAVGGILLLTASIKFCPIWFGFDINTNKKCDFKGQ